METSLKDRAFMKVRAGDIILSLIALYLGIFLIYAGGRGGWGLIYAAVGALFTVIGASSALLSLGNLNLPFSPFLRRGVVLQEFQRRIEIRRVLVAYVDLYLLLIAGGRLSCLDLQLHLVNIGL